MNLVSSKHLHLYLLISFGIGFLASNLWSHENPIVKYVSQEEILELEKSRMDLISNAAEKNMFFGRPKEAADTIEEYVIHRKIDGEIIVMSSSKLFGDNTQSISKDAYEHVIKTLGSQDETSN